jgi:hypothetical protein
MSFSEVLSPGFEESRSGLVSLSILQYLGHPGFSYRPWYGVADGGL